MTRRDYIRIAEVFATERATRESVVAAIVDDREAVYRAGAQLAVCDRMAGRMADLLAEDNPRFSRDMFLAACGVPGAGRAGR